MKKIDFNKMQKVYGGVTSRECYVAGVSLVLTSSWVLGYVLGFQKRQLDTLKGCFNGE